MTKWGTPCETCGLDKAMCLGHAGEGPAAQRLRDFTRDWSEPERRDVEEVINRLKRDEVKS